MPRPARLFLAALAPLLALAVLAGCSSDDGASATEPDTQAFCTAYTAYFEENDKAKVEDLYDEARPLAPKDIAALLDAAEEADRDGRAQDEQDLRGDIADWRAANCDGMAAATTTTVALDAQTLDWCDSWARYIDQRPSASADTYLEMAEEQAPEKIAGRMSRYLRDIQSGETSTDVELEMNSYWHSTCPGGVNRPGSD